MAKRAQRNENEGFVVRMPPIEALHEGKIDNWANRVRNMHCLTCMFYMAKEGGIVKSVKGRCRRHAPTLGGWPVVFDTDWCGDHKLV